MKKPESGADPPSKWLPTSQEPESREGEKGTHLKTHTHTHTLAISFGQIRRRTSPAWPCLTITVETIRSPAINTAGALEMLTQTWQHAHAVHAKPA